MCFEFHHCENVVVANYYYVPYLINNTHDKEILTQKCINLIKPFIINLEISYDINKLNKLIKGSLNTIIFDKPQTKNRVLEKIINNVNNV